MDNMQAWIGRIYTQQDEITRPALLRIAALLDIADPDFQMGAPIPAHWYAMFFPEIAPQSQLSLDGHSRRGDFLPPVALPRQMFAGRRVTVTGKLRVGDIATKCSEIIAIKPKTGRSGAMVFVTIRYVISAGGGEVLVGEQDVVFCGAADPNAQLPTSTPAPTESTWSETVTPTTTLLFRYSAITFNGHRIHYDADYTRGEEGYPALVMNGGLTALLLTEAASRAYGRAPSGLTFRNVRPLFCGNPMTLAGDGRGLAWAADSDGALSVSATFTF
jgi:3-methylfumaryl-CoA hydratase